jgi:membrane protease YdiL (CAAX protease family)
MAKAAATALRVEKRDIGLYLIVTGIVAALGMVYIGVSSALSSTCTAGHAGPKGCTFSISFVALIVAAVVTESAGLIAVGLRRQAGWSYFGLRRVALIQSLLARYIPLFGVSQFDFGDQAPLADLVVFGLFAVLAAPVIEEIFFRGILLRALWSKLSFGVAAVLSSALFAAVHGLNGATISIFIFALYLSYMYRRLGSIVPGMALHAINNAIAFAVLAVTGKA